MALAMAVRSASSDVLLMLDASVPYSAAGKILERTMYSFHSMLTRSNLSLIAMLLALAILWESVLPFLLFLIKKLTI